jgi:hypothetical protein
MSGQIPVDVLSVDAIPEALAALTQTAFSLTPVQEPKGVDEAFCCRRGDRQLFIGIDAYPGEPQQKWVVLAYPPYSWLPCRWAGDGRLFGEVTATLDGFSLK